MSSRTQFLSVNVIPKYWKLPQFPRIYYLHITILSCSLFPIYISEYKINPDQIIPYCDWTNNNGWMVNFKRRMEQWTCNYSWLDSTNCSRTLKHIGEFTVIKFYTFRYLLLYFLHTKASHSANIHFTCTKAFLTLTALLLIPFYFVYWDYTKL